MSRFRDFNPPYCRILVCVKVPCASFTAIPMSPLVYTRLQMAFSLQPQGAQAMGCHIRVCICSNFGRITRNKLKQTALKSCAFLSLCLCEISADFGAKLAEIGYNFAETQRKECTRLQGSLFQFISRYSPETRVHILYHRNPIQTLMWHPIAWVSCASTRISMADTKCVRFDFCRYYRPQRTLLE